MSRRAWHCTLNFLCHLQCVISTQGLSMKFILSSVTCDIHMITLPHFAHFHNCCSYHQHDDLSSGMRTQIQCRERSSDLSVCEILYFFSYLCNQYRLRKSLEESVLESSWCSGCAVVTTGLMAVLGGNRLSPQIHHRAKSHSRGVKCPRDQCFPQSDFHWYTYSSFKSLCVSLAASEGLEKRHNVRDSLMLQWL